jgi:hypothetical protein
MGVVWRFAELAACCVVVGIFEIIRVEHGYRRVLFGFLDSSGEVAGVAGLIGLPNDVFPAPERSVRNVAVTEP